MEGSLLRDLTGGKMLRALGRLRNLYSGARDGLRREEMDGAHFATLGDRPFIGCCPCAPEPQDFTIFGAETTSAANPVATGRTIVDSD